MKLIGKRTMSRRRVLRGAGGVVVGLPFLSIMGEGTARAADGAPKRLVVMYSPNGFNAFPTSMNLEGTPFTPLNRHKDHLTILRGLDMKSAKADANKLDASHYLGWGHVMVGDNVWSSDVAGNISADMLAAQRIGQGTPHPYSLQKIPHDEDRKGISWLGGGNAAVPTVKPRDVFNRMFSDFNVDPAEIEARNARQKSVLDYVMGSIKRTQCELGQNDKERLERHLDAVRDVENRLGLTGGGGVSCSMPGQPTASTNFPEVAQAHRDLLAMSFACDLTRVGVLQYSHVAGGGTPVWVDSQIPDTHHELSHRSDAEGKAWYAAVTHWYANEMALFLDDMINYEDAAGQPLLQNTTVVWVAECGFPAYEHIGDLKRSVNLPVIMAGSAGGALKTNHYQDLSGVPHQNLWVEVINAVSPEGMAPLTSFGNAATCTGGIAQLRA